MNPDIELLISHIQNVMQVPDDTVLNIEELSAAFIKLVEYLAEQEKSLEDKGRQVQLTKASLEQSTHLLTALMHYVPQQIIVLKRNTREVLQMNGVAKSEVKGNPDYLDQLMHSLDVHNALDHSCDLEISFMQGKHERFFMIKTYLLEWNSIGAEILAISDVTGTRHQVEESEDYKFYDSFTQLYNRSYGMLTLETWIHEKRQFALIFVDLDSLKYVNDEFGHNEGDLYISNAVKYLRTFAPDTVVCRNGGDEFMMLAPDISFESAEDLLNDIHKKFSNEEYLHDKTFRYSICFGIVAIKRSNTLSASDILSIADERLYQNKRARKIARKQAQTNEFAV